MNDYSINANAKVVMKLVLFLLLIIIALYKWAPFRANGTEITRVEDNLKYTDSSFKRNCWEYSDANYFSCLVEDRFEINLKDFKDKYRIQPTINPEKPIKYNISILETIATDLNILKPITKKKNKFVLKQNLFDMKLNLDWTTLCLKKTK